MADTTKAITNENKLGSVTVYGKSILEAPLLDTPDVGMIVVKDVFGDPMMLLTRLSVSDVWGLSSRGDADFSTVLERYGLQTGDKT